MKVEITTEPKEPFTDANDAARGAVKRLAVSGRVARTLPEEN